MTQVQNGESRLQDAYGPVDGKSDTKASTLSGSKLVTYVRERPGIWILSAFALGVLVGARRR